MSDLYLPIWSCRQIIWYRKWLFLYVGMGVSTLPGVAWNNARNSLCSASRYLKHSSYSMNSLCICTLTRPWSPKFRCISNQRNKLCMFYEFVMSSLVWWGLDTKYYVKPDTHPSLHMRERADVSQASVQLELLITTIFNHTIDLVY